MTCHSGSVLSVQAGMHSYPSMAIESTVTMSRTIQNSTRYHCTGFYGTVTELVRTVAGLHTIWYSSTTSHLDLFITSTCIGQEHAHCGSVSSGQDLT
jgi:hypothetical protein